MLIACATPSGAAPSVAPLPFRQVDTITLRGSEGWDYLTVGSADRRLYVTRGTRVTCLSLDSNGLIDELTGLNGVHGVAVNDEDEIIFVTNGKSNTVSLHDSFTFLHTGDVPAGNNPDAIVYDRASKLAFAFNHGGNSATVIDTEHRGVIAPVILPGKPEFAVTDGKGHVYVNIEDTSQICAIDAKKRVVTATWSLSPCTSPTGLAIDAKHNRLFATCDGGKMAVVDTKTGKVVATPAIGEGPDAAAFDPVTGNVFSSNGKDGTITILHQRTPDIYDAVATLPTKVGARTMAIDVATHRIYTIAGDIAADDAGASNTQQHRRSYLPGSVAILVYGAE
jgi:DNA-binding beta-propeller fold protein YncE